MFKNDDTKTLEILLIEDNEDDAERIEKSLDPERYHITNVWNGKMALDFLIKRDNDIDVVLLDEGLPYKNGLEILKKTKKKGKEYAFIFLTIDNTVETAAEAMKLGALDFLPKSSGFEDLPEMIEKVYEIHQHKLEYKQAEETLQKSEQKFRNLADDLPSMVFINQGGKVVFANQTCHSLMGNTLEEFLSPDFNFLSIITPESLELIKDKLNEHMQGKKVAPYEYTLLTKDGKRLNAIMTSRLIDYEGGPAILGIITDITERKQTEKKLIQKNEQFNLVIQGANLGWWDWDISSGKETYNEILPELLGYELSEIQPYIKWWEDKIHTDDLEQVGIDLQEHFDGKTEFYINKHRLKTRTGKWKWFLDHGKVVTRDKEGKPIRMIGTLRDIDNQQRAEEALRESEEKMRTILNSMPDVILQLDTDLKTLWANKTAKEMKPDIIGQLCYEALTGRNNQCPDCLIVKALKTGKIEKGIVHLQSAAGVGESYWDDVGIPIKDAQGRIISMVKLSRNVTERMQAEEDIRKLSHAVEQSTSIIVITDTKGIFEYVNSKFTQVTGYDSEEIIGKKAGELWEQTPEESKRMWSTITSGGELQLEFRNKRKNGEFYWESASISSITNPEGVITNFIKVAEDITERKQAEEELKNKMNELEIFNDAAVDRELIINELRKEINELLKKSGKEAKYEIAE